MGFEKLVQQLQVAHAEEVRQAAAKEAAKHQAKEEGIAAREKNLNAVLDQRDKDHAWRKARIVTLESEAKVAAGKLAKALEVSAGWEKLAKAVQADVARLDTENKELKAKIAGLAVVAKV